MRTHATCAITRDGDPLLKDLGYGLVHRSPDVVGRLKKKRKKTKGKKFLDLETSSVTFGNFSNFRLYDMVSVHQPQFTNRPISDVSDDCLMGEMTSIIACNHPVNGRWRKFCTHAICRFSKNTLRHSHLPFNPFLFFYWYPSFFCSFL